MQARTIELSQGKTAQIAAGGKIVVRTLDLEDVEVLTPPKGRVALNRGSSRRGAEIIFGSLTKATLVIRGTAAQLDPIFKGVTGVDP